MLWPGTGFFGPQKLEVSFETRFRMTQAVFNIIFTSVSTSSEYFQKGLRTGATIRVSISLPLKLLWGI